MKTINLFRIARDEVKTSGVFTYKGDIVCLSLELQWLLNRPFFSCIPEGEYFCKWIAGRIRYEVIDVPNRTLIRIHTGNEIDLSKPKIDDTDGCILTGDRFTFHENGLRAQIHDSANAIMRLYSVTGDEEFILKIREM